MERMKNKTKVKIALYLAFVIFFCMTFVIFSNTLALFEDNADGLADMDIGAWVIKLNNITITGEINQELNINSFIYDTNSTVKSGTIAPGMSAYFDLVFDATDCDVAVKYDITFKLDEINYSDNISFSVQEIGGNSTILTDENTYSGIIDLNKILNNNTVKLRVYVTWNDFNTDAYNTNDTLLGTTKNSKITVPIGVHAIQYLGETISPYVPNGTSGD